MRSILLVIISIWFSITLSASHISGVNISYECLGGDDYLVTVNLFRDCQDQLDLPDLLNVFIGSTCLNLGYIKFPQVDLIEVSQLCEDQLPNSTCNGGFQPGVQMGVYQYAVQLEPCIDWRMVVSEQTRDGSIVNLVDPVLFSVHTDAFLNNSSNICNNSPVLSLLNLPNICVGTELFYNLGFLESDGDSLSYALVNAQASEAPNLPFDLDYVPPYSGTEPMPGMTIDPVNGQISVTPTTIGRFTTVVEVREYRNGNLIGVVHYDFLFLVNACPIPPPEPDLDTFAHESGGGYPLSNNTIGLCPEDNFCFEIAFVSTDPSINVDLKSNLHLLVPGATETVTGTNPATIQFCGTLSPDFDGGSFIITAIDDACPVYGQNFYTIDFAFREPIKAFGDTSICAGETVQISAVNDTVYTWYSLSGNLLVPGDEISCNPCQAPFVSPDTSTYYVVEGQYANSTCAYRDTVFVDVALSIDVSSSSETCAGNNGVISIDVLTGSGDYQVVWNDIGIGPLSRNDLVAGTYTAEIFDNVYNCSRVDTFSIIKLPPPDSYAGEDFEICGHTANLAAEPSYGVPLWSSIPGVVYNDPADGNTSVSVSSEGTYQFIWKEDAGGVGCIDSDTVQVTFYAEPSAEIITPDSVCGLVSEVNANVQNGIPQWTATSGLDFDDPAEETTNITADTYGLTTLYLEVENGTCYTADTASVLFIEQPVANAGDDVEVCGPNAEITGIDVVGNGVWILPAEVSSTSDLTDLSIPISAPGYGDFEIIRTLTNMGFCIDTDTIQVRFTEIPDVDIGADKDECDSITLINFVLPVGDLSWEVSQNLIDPGNVASPQEITGSYGSHQAILKADNGSGCIGSDTININFTVQPHLESLLTDTVCGLEYELNADLVADDHYWLQPNGASISDLNNPNASVTASVEGSYTFYWVAENSESCRDTSTVPVLFYNQPVTDAGEDLKICGLSTELDAIVSHGVLIWEDQPGLTFSNQLSPNAQVTADWYTTHIIHLQEVNGICTDSDSLTVEFISTPQILNPQWECTGTDAEFTLNFDVSLGDTANYEIQGLVGELNNFHFQSQPLLSETPVQVILEDFGYCGGDTLTGTWFCPVITYAGTMDPDTIRLCGDALVEALPTLGASLDGNDTLLYAFHDGSEDALGNIYDWNEIPNFIFSDILDFSETYFISAVAGNALNGGVDLNDPFLSVSIGTPVEFYELPFGEISGDIAACPYDTVFIPVNLSGDLPQEITYSVGNESFTVFTDSYDFSLAVVDSGAVQLLSTESESCMGSATGSVQVSYHRIPEVSISSPSEICDGDTAFIELEFEGTQPFTGDILQNGNPWQNINSEIDSLGFYTTEGGSFSVVNFSDQNCNFSDTVSSLLDIKPMPNFSAGGDLSLCTGDTILIGTESIAGQTYTWQPNENLLQTDMAQVEYAGLSNSPFPQFEEVFLTAELDGCFDTDTALITINPRPQPQILGGDFICSGDSTWLIGYGGANYEWSPAQYFSDPAENTTQFFASANTVIELAAVSEAGCEAVTSTEIQVREKPNAVFGVSELSGCAPLNIQLSALSANTENEYNWSLTGISNLGNNPVANSTLAEAGTYTASLTVTSPNGCSQTEVMTENIEVFSTFSDFAFSPKKPDVNHPEVYFANYSPEGVMSTWSVDSLVFSDARNTSYTFPRHIGASYNVCLAVVDTNMCRDRKCQIVKLKNDFEVYVPTAFTPNGDGMNDLFYPVLSNIDVVEYKFWITNPRGHIVFSTTDVNEKWDGSVGREGDAEYYGENKIYNWHLIAKPNFNVETSYFTGHVMLLR